MAVRQYPHTLLFTVAGTDSAYDENGWPVAGTPGVEVHTKCRYEESSSRGDSTVRGIDNETYRQAGVIFLPLTTLFLPSAGAMVEIPGMFQGRVTQPYRGQLNITIKVY